MESPRGLFVSFWNFIRFLHCFIALLVIGSIKGIILCPLICLIITAGSSAIMVGLWPVHCSWTLYCVLSAKRFGPVLKIVICVFLPVFVILWPLIGIVSSIIGGAAYGFLAPIFATFQAVVEGKTDQFLHCIFDGICDTVKASCTVVRDLGEVCYHSYFSVVDDLQHQVPPEVDYYEIRLLHLPGAIVAGALGLLVDVPIISVVALCKTPCMLVKGWRRLFHDCIGHEGPFLETMCVPFAGLAILLWPLAVAGAVLGSMLSSFILGVYAAVVVYQESSFWLGLCYIIASLSIYDEYSNDFLDMPEGSCFPRPCYRKKNESSLAKARTSSFSWHDSFRNSLSHAVSLKGPMFELKPVELLDSLFKECQRHGEIMVSEGVITLKDIEDAKLKKDSGRIISIGLPAYCIFKTLLHSTKANSVGILLNECTEITSTNRPRDTFFDWFLNPLLIIKEQIKAENLSEAEEKYMGKLVLLGGDPARVETTNLGSAPESELKRAELDALARRLQGITKSISRYPTFRRRFDARIKIMSEKLGMKNGCSRPANTTQTVSRTGSKLAQIFSQKSLRSKKKPGFNLENQISW